MQSITYKVFFGILIAAFISITGYFASAVITKLAQIQKDLMSIQLQIAEINSKTDKNFIMVNAKILSRQQIKQLISDEISKHILTYHENK